LLAGAFFLALLSTSAFLREPEKIDLFCRAQFDVVTITRAAREADLATIAGWWHGPWIQREMPYYRPLTSMLFLAEWRLFGERYLLYSLVSWLLHALNTLLLCALVYRLIAGSARRRAAVAALAAALFTVPYWGNQGAAMQMLFWWPSQGDMVSLGFGLVALLAWDELVATGRNGIRRLLAPMVVMVLAILAKEMAYVVPGLMALLLIRRPVGQAHRPSPRRRSRIPRRRSRGGRRGSPGRRGVPALAVFPFLVAAVLWLLRRVFVPEALGFKWKGLYSLQKLYYHLGGPLGPMAIVGDWTLPVAAAGAALLLGLAARRHHLPIGVLAAGGWAALVFQWLGTSWARVLLAPNPWFLARGIVYWFSLFWLWRSRREEPVLFALGALLLIHLPLLHHGGVHYTYWPSAAWAVTNAVVVASLSSSIRTAVGGEQSFSPDQYPIGRTG
jgi:hypothetical protein